MTAIPPAPPGWRQQFPTVEDAVNYWAPLATSNKIRIDVQAEPCQNVDFLSLDGNADGDYLLEYHLVAAQNGNFRIEPENDTVNLESNGYFTNGVSGPTAFPGGVNLLIDTVSPGNTYTGYVLLQSRNGQGNRYFQSFCYQSNHFLTNMQGLWLDSTTPLTKLRINHSSLGGIDVGSWFTLTKLHNNIASTSVGGGSPALATIRPATKMAVLGDSIPSTVYNTFLPIWNAASAHFGPSFAPLINAGHPSDTIEQVQVRTQAQVVDAGADFVIVYMGRNNYPADIPDGLVQYGRTLDILILGGIPAANIVCVSVIIGENTATPNPTRDELNNGISALAAARGCVYANIIPAQTAWETVNNPGNDPSGHMTIDGTHPNPLGVTLISNFPAGWMWPFLTMVP